MSEILHCPVCKTALPENASEGFCPVCELRRALQDSAAEPQSSAQDHVSQPARELTSPTPDDLTKIRFFGDYELLEEIARGGMGIVFKARQISLNRIVAVKMILAGRLADQQFVHRFRTEAAAAAILQHPNIVAVHEVGFHDGQHFFSMDYVEGQNLAQLAGERPLPPDRAARYLKVIAEAIHHAHEHNILHRDLKPSNVLIDANDQPHVTDFGLARRIDGESSLTLTGQVLGSLSYMPPEQAAALHQKVSRQSDVYGLGAICYHLLTGLPPFQGTTMPETVHLVMNKEPRSPRLLNPQVPRDLETICLKCLEKAPEQRYSTAWEVVEELTRFLDNEPIHSRPIGTSERIVRWCRRKPAIATLAAILVLSFTLGGVGWLKFRDRSRAVVNLVSDTDLLIKEAFNNTNNAAVPRLLQALHVAIQAHPSEFLLWHSKAQVLIRTNRVEEAIVAIGKAIELANANTNVPAKSRVALLLTRSKWLRKVGRKKEALADYVEAGRINREYRGITKHDPGASDTMLDLSPFFRAELSSWLEKLMIEDESTKDPLEARVERDTGIAFDLRGVLDLSSLSEQSKQRQKEASESVKFPALRIGLPPDGLKGVVVDQRFAKLHVLHGCSGIAPLPSKTKQRIGKYVLHYTDGSTEEISLRYSRDVRDVWCRDPLPASGAKVAIQGKAVAGKDGKRVQFFHATFDNPRLEAEVSTIDLVVTAETVSPILLAATVDKGSPEMPEFWAVKAGEAEQREGVDAAMRVFDEGSKQFPEEPRLWYLRGTWLERQQRMNDALGAFSNAITVATRNGENVRSAQWARARVLVALGRLDEAATGNCQAWGIPLRPPRTRRELIDLSAYYNNHLYQFLVQSKKIESILQLSAALLAKTGVEFDVRGILGAYGRSADIESGSAPISFAGIPVRQQVSRLHILHCATYGEAIDKKIGAYVFHYRDGRTEELPILYHQNIGGFNENVPVPSARTITVEATSQFKRSYIYNVVWLNPHPEVEIVSFDFNSMKTGSSPRLLAMTVEH